MMPGSFESQKHVSVFETTLSIQQNTLSVFNIIIQSSQSTVSLIRYPFDLVEFHQKIRFYYPKSKISFPTLNNPSKRKVKQDTLRYSNNSKRRSFRDLLPFSTRKKSNSDKIEKYLQCCFQHPIISLSSLLKDFTSVQRDEDALLTSQHTSTTLTPTLHSMIKKKDTIVHTEEEGSSSSNNNSQPIFLLPPTNNKNNTPIVTTTADAPIILPESIIQIEEKQQQEQDIINDFHVLKVLGKGCMGKVLLVRSKNNDKLYALKSIKKKWVIQQKEVIHTLAERNILVKLRNQPFIANLNHIFQTSSQLFFVLDYYSGGDIATQLSIVSSFSEERTRFYAAEIIYGLKILHGHGIVYRDLKPENVLIGRDGHIVLTDFGLSKIFSEKDVDEYNVPFTQTFCGTAEYLAPEILLGEKYTFVVDFWSLGTLLYEMLAGTTPFWADNHMDMYKRVLEDNLEFPPQFDSVTCNFLSGLLEKEAVERLGWGEDGIEDIMLHPYFNSIDWNLVPQKKLMPSFVPKIKNDTDLTHFDTVFTNLPVRISQSSSMDYNAEEDDPFQHFSFDHITTSDANVVQQQEMNNNNNNRIKKRHSAALFSTNNNTSTSSTEAGPSSSSYFYDDNNRIIKKRQTNSNQIKSNSNSLSDLLMIQQSSNDEEEDDIIAEEEEQSSIYSKSSLTFSFGREQEGTATATRANSELSISMDTVLMNQHYATLNPPYERSNCPIPGQTRNNNLPHSNASTLANSMCSYLLDNNDINNTSGVVQQQQQQEHYFTATQQQQHSSSSIITTTTTTTTTC